jgi:hypothetical protein
MNRHYIGIEAKRNPSYRLILRQKGNIRRGGGKSRHGPRMETCPLLEKTSAWSVGGVSTSCRHCIGTFSVERSIMLHSSAASPLIHFSPKTASASSSSPCIHLEALIAPSTEYGLCSLEIRGPTSSESVEPRDGRSGIFIHHLV